MGAVGQEFYKDSDLQIGAYVNIWGRKFLICDCDDFTKEYYNVKYGISKSIVCYGYSLSFYLWNSAHELTVMTLQLGLF